MLSKYFALKYFALKIFALVIKTRNCSDSLKKLQQRGKIAKQIEILIVFRMRDREGLLL